MRRRSIALTAASVLTISLAATGAAPAALAAPAQEIDDTALQDATRHESHLEGWDLERSRGWDEDRRSDHALRRELDRAARGLVAQGAVGVTARVESPDFDWRGSAGSRSYRGWPQAEPEDRFRVASITKTMVATVVLQEVEAGSFALDTPVNDLVPDLFPHHPDITVEHLLSHRSGAQTATAEVLANRIDDPTDWNQFVDAVGQDYTAEDHLAAVNSLPWAHEPGEGFNYSNAGYIALGHVLTEVTGVSVADLVKDRVFDAAGMGRTTFPDDPGTRGRFLQDAAFTGAPSEGGIGWTSLRGFDPDVFGAAGAVVSTTKDLNRFTEALLEGELVDATLVQEMITPRTEAPIEYGLGIYRLPDPCTEPGDPPAWLYGHDGGSFGTGSIAMTSADGTRQFSLGVSGRDLTTIAPSYDIGELVEPMAAATC